MLHINRKKEITPPASSSPPPSAATKGKLIHLHLFPSESSACLGFKRNLQTQNIMNAFADLLHLFNLNYNLLESSINLPCEAEAKNP